MKKMLEGEEKLIRVSVRTARLLEGLRTRYSVDGHRSIDLTIRGLWRDYCKLKGGMNMTTVLLHKIVPCDCFEPECILHARLLFITTSSGNYVTFICDHQKEFSEHNEGIFWNEEILLEALRLREEKKTYKEITENINTRFGTKLEGVQRPDGKGYRGAVTRKFARMARCEWNQQDTDELLLSKARQAFSINAERKNSQQTDCKKTEKTDGDNH